MNSSLPSNWQESNKWHEKRVEVTFDPVTSLRKHPVTYNIDSAKLLSSPAYFTDICGENSSSSTFGFKSVSKTVDDICSKLNGSCENENSDDDVLILEGSNMPPHSAPLSKDCCQSSNQFNPTVVTDSKSTQEQPFTISAIRSLKDIEKEQVPTSQKSAESFEDIPFITCDKSNPAPEPFGISCIENSTNAASWNVVDPDNLYDNSDAPGQLNFHSYFSQQLSSSQSSVRIAQNLLPISDKPKEVDVIELSDSEDETADCTRLPAVAPATVVAHRLSRSDRIMPQLIPLLENSESQDENNNSRSVTPVELNPPCVEVIDIPSSPEMPKLIPFTSQTEEPFKNKVENSEAGMKCNNVPLSNMGDNFQPQVVLKKLSMECYNNRIAAGFIEDVEHKKDSDCQFADPDVDMIDGLNFYSFVTKSDMEVYCDKFSDIMSFRVKTEDDDDSIGKDNVIVPTKTHDITQIKGWRTKQFANDFTFEEDLALSYANEEDNQNLELSEVVSKKELPEDSKKLLEDSQNDSKPAMSAFVSDALEAFLKTDSELKVPILQEVNPNITPIPRNAPILSVGSLRKIVEAKETPSKIPEQVTPPLLDQAKTRKRKFSEELPSFQSKSSSAESSPEGPAPSFKVRKKSAGKVASDRVLKKSLQFKTKQDTSVSQRLVLRLKKEKTDVSDAYKIAETLVQDVKPTKLKINKTSPVKESDFSLIKETLFANDSKRNESNLLFEFIINLNRHGTRNDLTMLVNSKNTFFETTVITRNKAANSVLAVKPLHKLVASEQKKPYKGKRAVALRNLAAKIKGPKVKRRRRRRKVEATNDTNVSPGILGKRSIRMPVRFLDSAIPASRSEWVTPNVKFESKTEITSPVDSEDSKEAITESRTVDETISSVIISSVVDSSQNVKPETSFETNSQQEVHRTTSSDISKNKTAPSGRQKKMLARPKRMQLSPTCMCRNTSRLMPYCAEEKRLKCRCIDSIIEAIKNKEGLTDLHEGSEHNYAFINEPEEDETPNITIAADSRIVKSSAVNTQTRNSKLVNDKPKPSINEISKTVPVTNLTKEPAKKVKTNTIPIPGTNRFVSFVLVPTNSPKKSTTTSGQTPDVNTVSTSKPTCGETLNSSSSSGQSPVSASKSNISPPSLSKPGTVQESSNKAVIRVPAATTYVVKPPPTSQPSSTTIIQNYRNIVSNAIGKISLNSSFPSFQGKSETTASKESTILPLKSKPVIFSLNSQQNLDSVRKLTTIAVKKDCVHLEPSASSQSALSNSRSSSLAPPPLPTVTTSSPTESLCSNSQSKKNSQSLRAVRIGSRYVLCQSSTNESSSCNDIVTLYPGTDDSALMQAEVADQVSSSPMPNPSNIHQTGSPSPPQPSTSSKSQVSLSSVKRKIFNSPIDLMKNVVRNCKSPSSQIVATERSSQSCDEIDVVGDAGMFVGQSISVVSTPSISSSSEDDNSDNSSDERESTCSNMSKDYSEYINKALWSKTIGNRKKLMERARRKEIKTQLERLKNSDPYLKSKTNTVDVVKSAVAVVNHYTTQNFTLSMQVKVLLMRRNALATEYKKEYMTVAPELRKAEVSEVLQKLRDAVVLEEPREFPSPPSPYLPRICRVIFDHALSKEVKSDRDVMREVLNSLSRPKFRFGKRSIENTDENLLASNSFSNMKNALKNKISSPEKKDSLSQSSLTVEMNRNSELYEFLRCKETALSDEDSDVNYPKRFKSHESPGTSTAISSSSRPSSSGLSSKHLLMESSEPQPLSNQSTSSIAQNSVAFGTVPKYNSLLGKFLFLYDKLENKWDKITSSTPKVPIEEANLTVSTDTSDISDELGSPSWPKPGPRINSWIDQSRNSADSGSHDVSVSKWYSSFGVERKSSDSPVKTISKTSDSMNEEEVEEECTALIIDESPECFM